MSVSITEPLPLCVILTIVPPAATVDEHLQKVGAEAFNKFQRRVMNLDKEVR